MAHWPTFINRDAPYGTPPPGSKIEPGTLFTSPPSPDKTPGGRHPRYVSSPRFLAEHRLGLNRSQEEIVAKAKADNALGLTQEVLIDYLEWKHARGFADIKYVARVELGEIDEPVPLISPLIAVQDMLDYLVFGYEKALDERGLSASRTVWKLATWAWLLGREDLEAILLDDARYRPYGMPALIAFAEALNLAVPDECYRFAGMEPMTENAFRISKTLYAYKKVEGIPPVQMRILKGRDPHPCDPVPVHFNPHLLRPEDVMLAAASGWEEVAKLAELTGFPTPNPMDPTVAEDPHTATAAKIHGVDPADVTEEMRRVGKLVNYSAIYAKPPTLTVEQAWPNGEPTAVEAQDIVAKALAESTYAQPASYGLSDAAPANNYHNVERDDSPAPAYESPDPTPSETYDSSPCDSGDSGDSGD